VTFATVVLRRGMTTTRDLWTWFSMVSARGQYAHRRQATIYVYAPDGTPVLGWRLARAMPVKFKAADLNAQGTQVAIEELHLAHEGLSLVQQPLLPLPDGGRPSARGRPCAT
jgi:phage tail-like protein